MGDKYVHYQLVNFGNTACKRYVFVHLKPPKIFTDHDIIHILHLRTCGTVQECRNIKLQM